MTMRAWRVLVASSAIMLALTSNAAASPIVYSVTGLELAGNAEVHGSLAAARLHSESPLLPNLVLTAEAARAEEWRDEQAARVDGVLGGVSMPSYGNTSYSNLELRAEQTRGDFEIFIVPRGPIASTASIESSSLSLATHTENSVQEGVYFGNSSDHKPASIKGTLTATSLAQGSLLTITGDFDVVLWETDLAGKAAGRDVRIESGDKTTPFYPGAPAGSGRSVQVFLHVTNGRLDIQIDGNGFDSAFFTKPSGRADGSLLLRNPTQGNSQSPQLLLEGPLEFTTKQASGQVEITVGSAEPGDKLPQVIDPAPVEPDAIQSRSTGWDYSWSFVGVLGLTALAGGSGTVWGVSRHRLALLRADMTAGRFDEVVARSSRWLLGGGHVREASVMKAIAYLKSGRPALAADFLQTAPVKQQPDASTKQFLLACSFAQQEDLPAAVESLKECLTLEPGYVVEAAHNPWTGQLLNHPTIKVLIPQQETVEGYT
ncbi:MAG: tetratricopeptide repeat protein [Thermoplasmatota archaeon]